MTLHDTKNVVDGLSLGAVVGTFFGNLPAIAAFFSLIWTAIRIYETRTVQRWLGNEVPRHEQSN